jgi:hypothetical protein
MKIYWRWLKILFTCGLGKHLSPESTHLPDHSIYHECPRCHDAHYTRADSPNVVHLRPSYWDVARGKYDRGIQP